MYGDISMLIISSILLNIQDSASVLVTLLVFIASSMKIRKYVKEIFAWKISPKV